MNRLFAYLVAAFCAFVLLNTTPLFCQTPTSAVLPSNEPTLWERYVLGVNAVPEPHALFADVYPVIIAAGGFGINAGYETGHWQFGATFLTVPLNDGWRDWFLADASGVDVLSNRATEVFVNYFIRPDRQGFYAGVLGGPDWYDVRDKATGARETLMRVYVVPRVGVRWFPFQPYVYLDAAFGASVNESGSKSRPLGEMWYSARPLLAFAFI